MWKVREGPPPPVPVTVCVVLQGALPLVLSGKKKESRQMCADPSPRSLGTRQQEELLTTDT